MKKWLIGIIGGVVAIGIIGAILSGGTEDKGSDKSKGSDAKPAKKTTFTVGETAELDGVKVTFNSVHDSPGNELIKPEEGKTIVLCEFTIENGSSEDITISSLLNFEFYADDTKATVNALAPAIEDQGQLDGDISVGKKMTGFIGFDAPTDWQKIEVQVKPNLLKDALIFNSDKTA